MDKPDKEVGKVVGKVSGYFTKVGVAAIELEDALKVGDTIKIKGHTTDFSQKVDSMQIDRKDVKEAKKGDSVGIMVKERVRPNDIVYKE